MLHARVFVACVLILVAGRGIAQEHQPAAVEESAFNVAWNPSIA